MRMLDQKDFQRMRQQLEEFDAHRELAIQSSREVIKLSKMVIYALQRSDKKDAKVQLALLQKAMKKVPKESFDAGIQNVAWQEYVEAATLYSWLLDGRLPNADELGVSVENYLMGLCDLTGEVVRKAVQDVIQGNPAEARKIHGLVEALYGEFLQFNLRNGELRKKMDSIKWNLKKLDEILYDLKMKNSVSEEKS
jgi:translin